MPVDRSIYGDYEHLARERIETRDPDDWPAVAVALMLDADLDRGSRPVWKRHRDLDNGSCRGMPQSRPGALTRHTASKCDLSPTIDPHDLRQRNHKCLILASEQDVLPKWSPETTKIVRIRT